MSDQHTPLTDGQVFQILLNEKYSEGTLLPPLYQYVIASDPYQEEEPLNFWHKIKSKIGLKYKTKIIGYSYTVLRQEVIEGKIVVEYKGREE